jgi:very-short-patch-repair endonuclease
MDTTARAARLRATAQRQASVASRTQLYEMGYSRGEVRNNIRARRWRRLGAHCVILHCGPLAQEARYWAAVLEGGPRAVIDGEAALLLAGLQNYTVNEIRVSVPRGARIRHRGTVANIRQTRRWAVDDRVCDGVPRTPPGVAAVRAAIWAKSNRQAQLVMIMAVQQGLTSADELAAEMLRIRRDRRRLLLNEVVLELLGGIESLNELDVVRGCRARGLPEPDKQVCRRTPDGLFYLDFRWNRWGVVVEVDGIQHAWVSNLVADALRHNRIAIDGDTVLRLPVLGLRAQPEAFFNQIEDALRASGWRPLAA